jgi:hypothetical protein
MKKYLSIIIVCFGLFGMLTAQNVWKPMNCHSFFYGADSEGNLFAMGGYSGLLRSQDEGETWTPVLGYYMRTVMAFSPGGRIFAFPSDHDFVCYSDDHGDTWQETANHPNYYMSDAYAVNNDTLLFWSEDHLCYTLDAGETWNTVDVSLLVLGDEYHSIGDVIANEAGDVYVSKWYFSGEASGIFHSTLDDMQNWELAAFDGAVVLHMEFDPEGNVVACGHNAEGSGVGFQHIPGFYLFDGTSLVIDDGGIVYVPHFTGIQAVLAYSTDHGEHFTEIGEHLPLVDIAPGSENALLFKGADNHLYFDGGGEYWQSILDVNEIVKTYPAVLPEHYWYELVTSQPEGYVVDGQGDIHIYSAEALAWLISLSNGLNGAERDDFAGKTITLEADVDISEGIWTSIGTKNELPPSPPTKDDEFYFQGNFNGNGHVIYGMTTNEGFIGDIYNSRLENIVIKYAFAKDTEQGLLVNHFSNSVIDKCWLDCVVHVNDNGGYALFGYGGASTHITNCIFRSPLIDNPSGEIPHGAFCAFIEGNNAYNVVENCAIIVDSIAYPLDAPVVVENNSGLMRNCYSYIGTFKNFDPQAFLYNGRNGIVGIDYGSVEHCYYNWLDPEVYGEDVNNPALFSHEDLDATMFRWVDDEWTLLEPVTVGGMETDDLIEALNVWTNSQTNVSEYLQWHADYAVLPNGLPVLYEENNQFFPRGTEWYYEIKHLTGEITYQHLEYTADTAVNSKRVKIITETNTMYDKEQWTDYEYIYEEGDRIYWWNKDLEDFTLLYDFGAEVGDEWEINGGWYTITVHVDGVEETTLQGKTYRVLHVTDPNYQLFTGDIICGIGHQKSFFPGTPMAKDYEVDGLRCYWQDGELVLTMGEEDCDAVYYEIHGVEEGDNAGFEVYPNPTDGIITVEMRCNASLQQEYRITNILGQRVKSGFLTADRQQIDVHDLTEGMYFITMGGKTKLLLKSL